MADQMTFKRYEIKYMLTCRQEEQIKQVMVRKIRCCCVQKKNRHAARTGRTIFSRRDSRAERTVMQDFTRQPAITAVGNRPSTVHSIRKRSASKYRDRQNQSSDPQRDPLLHAELPRSSSSSPFHLRTRCLPQFEDRRIRNRTLRCVCDCHST